MECELASDYTRMSTQRKDLGATELYPTEYLPAIRVMML